MRSVAYDLWLNEMRVAGGIFFGRKVRSRLYLYDCLRAPGCGVVSVSSWRGGEAYLQLDQLNVKGSSVLEME